MVMLIVGFLQWWYSIGWMDFALKLVDRLKNLADFFSLGLLFKTFFSPFRQISAYTSDDANIKQQITEFFDKLLSRIIGAVVRFLVIIVGIITLTAVTLFWGILFLAWPLMPFAPIAGIVLTIMGVTL